MRWWRWKNESAGTEPNQLAMQECYEDTGLAPLKTRLAPFDMH